MTREEVENTIQDCLLKIKDAIKQYPDASSRAVCLSVWHDHVSAFQLTDDEREYTLHITNGRI